MAYNLTNITGSLDPVTTILELNITSNYGIGIFLILAITIMTTMILIRIGTTPIEALSTAGFITGISSIFFMAIGLISVIIAIPFILLSVLLAVIGFITRNQ